LKKRGGVRSGTNGPENGGFASRNTAMGGEGSKLHGGKGRGKEEKRNAINTK